MFAGIIGPSGAGKTTLLKSIIGLAQRYSGEMFVNGKLLAGSSIPRDIGYVPQVETVDWSFPATVEHVVLMGLSTKPGLLPGMSDVP